MRAKEFMMQVHRAEAELKMINARRRHYEDLMKSMGSSMANAVSKPSGSSRVEAAAVGLVDMTAELDSKAAEYSEIIRKAERLIARIPQEKFRQVLTLHYLAGLSMKTVSDEMHYSDEKSVYRCRKYALQELQKLL